MGWLRGRKPRSVQTLVAVVLLLLLFGAYAGVLQYNAESAATSRRLTIEERDTLYFAVHGAVLLAAVVAGFIAGKWLNGLGFAYAVLFVAVLFSAMILAQIGAHTAACHGHNDVFRHWTC